MSNWQASETLSGLYKFELVWYIYMYMGMEVRVPIIVVHAMHM